MLKGTLASVSDMHLICAPFDALLGSSILIQGHYSQSGTPPDPIVCLKGFLMLQTFLHKANAMQASHTQAKLEEAEFSTCMKLLGGRCLPPLPLQPLQYV
jgi:hypothetical protein